MVKLVASISSVMSDYFNTTWTIPNQKTNFGKTALLGGGLFSQFKGFVAKFYITLGLNESF